MSSKSYCDVCGKELEVGKHYWNEFHVLYQVSSNVGLDLNRYGKINSLCTDDAQKIVNALGLPYDLHLLELPPVVSHSGGRSRRLSWCASILSWVRGAFR